MEDKENTTQDAPKIGDIYRHFKNKNVLYQVIAIATYICSSVGSLTQNNGSVQYESSSQVNFKADSPVLTKQGKKMVVYLCLTTNQTYVRDLTEWNDKVLYNGIITSRFIKHEKNQNYIEKCE